VSGVRFDLGVPGDVRFGRGRLAEVPGALAALAVTRVLVVTGRSPARADATRAALTAAGCDSVVLPVPGEPTVELVREGVALARAQRCDGVLGLGGGSALDAAKAVAVLAASGADPLDHLEVVGRGVPVTRSGLPCVAVPTTAGTGAEVTRNAVLSTDGGVGGGGVGGGGVGRGVKVSLRGAPLLPRLAVVDPDLLAGLPAGVVAAGGMDALTQLIEPFLSARANPVTDALARDGLRRSARSLRRAFEAGFGSGGTVGEDLALASLFGGLCLAGAGLGAVHGFAGVVGGRLQAPHGAVCAALLAPTLEVTARALAERAPRHPAAARLAEVAALLTGVPGATAADGVTWVRDLVTALGLPGLAQHGLTDADAAPVVDAAARASSMKAHPIELTRPELLEILRAAA